MLSSIIAIGWEPELRGILIVIIAVAALNGTVYLVMATNLGARLGFLVALAGLAGWMALMGIIWMDLRHRPEGSRTVVGGRPGAHRAAGFPGVRRRPRCSRTCPMIPDEPTFAEEADLVAAQFAVEGWEEIDPSSPAFGQAGAAAQTFLEETGAFAAGEFQVERIFDTGGERYPKINEAIDFLAFFHEPHHVVVEVAATGADANRARACRAVPGGRREPTAPVRLHGPRPRDSAPTGDGARDRRHDDLPVAVLDPAPPRPDGPSQHVGHPRSGSRLMNSRRGERCSR